MEQGGALLILLSAAVLLIASQATAENICQASDPPNQVVPYPDPYNCSNYYECLNGNAVLEHCEDGLLYNAIVQSCDFPENVDCTPILFQCPDNSTSYHEYPGDCTSYIECHLGDSYLMQCPPGLWWSGRGSECVDPEESLCGKTTVSPTTVPWTTPDPLCLGVRPGHISLKPYPGNCSMYYRCDGAQLTVQVCGDGLFYNDEKQTCDFPDAVDCPWAPTRPPDWTTTTPASTPTPHPLCADGNTDYWPIEGECDKYLECNRGSAIEMPCPPGLMFDSLSKSCVDPINSDCGRTSPTMPSTPSRGTDWTPHPDCPNDNSQEFLFPYPGDCTKYISCWRGDYHVMDCPPGLWFNPSIKDCDYPYEAGCEWGKQHLMKRLFNF